jgi:hypothetical protein
MKDSWDEKNDFVNLLYEKGYLTDDEHRCLLTGTVYNGKRYIVVDPCRAFFKDSQVSGPFLTIFTGHNNKNKLCISIVENGNVVDSSVVEL